MLPWYRVGLGNSTVTLITEGTTGRQLQVTTALEFSLSQKTTKPFININNDLQHLEVTKNAAHYREEKWNESTVTFYGNVCPGLHSKS